MKITKENETINEIKKNFDTIFVHLIVYIYLVYIYLSFIVDDNQSTFNLEMKAIIQEKLMLEDFPFQFTIYDYNTKNKDLNNNYWKFR